MDQRKTRLEERIRSVQISFVASLPQTITDISQRWGSLRHTAWEVSVLQDLQSMVHRLAGSGGTFGFPDISRMAAALDSALGQARQYHDEAPPETKVALEGQVNDLLLVLRAALTSDAAESLEPLLTTPVVGAQKLVVVIDDDDFLRERIAVLLEGAGYRVETFASPAKAIGLLQEEGPALVLLDLMFPGQRWPAFEVIADIRGETGERTPVAVMSGHVDFRSRLDATRAGADAYIVKPLNEGHLLEIVSQLVSRRMDDSWRCLIIDDDELLAQHIVTWLQQAGMIATWVGSARDSWFKVREFRPDVLILDVNMPECNGIEFATMLRQEASTSQLPIVFLTSDTGERTRRHAMAAGADDYLLKPISRSALLQAVTARARLGKRIQDQVGKVTQQAPQGTGLSRYFFFNELEKALDEADDSAIQPALVLLGLVEGPKTLQQHGAMGVAALQEQLVARLAKGNVPMWSMLGENTIGVLLTRDTAVGHKTFITELLSRLSVMPYTVNSAEVASSACAATLHLRHGQAAGVILMQAEQMLGLALDSDPGTILEGFAGAAQQVESTGQLPLNRLRAVYQPIVTIGEDGDPVNMVLARLTDSDGNLLPAGRFLSALEKRGWLPDLDAWVFRHAHHMVTTEIAESDSACLVVHASSQSLSSVIYRETVAGILHEQPMRNPKQRLIVAIAETTVITHRSMVDHLRKVLTEAGCGLMITNYGQSGHAVSVLQQVQPDFVRLDETLSRRLEQSEYKAPDRVLIDAADRAGALVVASGIESASSLSGLWEKGIRWFQGYFVQEPSSTLQSGT